MHFERLEIQETRMFSSMPTRLPFSLGIVLTLAACSATTTMPGGLTLDRTPQASGVSARKLLALGLPTKWLKVVDKMRQRQIPDSKIEKLPDLTKRMESDYLDLTRAPGDLPFSPVMIPSETGWKVFKMLPKASLLSPWTLLAEGGYYMGRELGRLFGEEQFPDPTRMPETFRYRPDGGTYGSITFPKAAPYPTYGDAMKAACSPTMSETDRLRLNDLGRWSLQLGTLGSESATKPFLSGCSSSFNDSPTYHLVGLAARDFERTFVLGDNFYLIWEGANIALPPEINYQDVPATHWAKLLAEFRPKAINDGNRRQAVDNGIPEDGDPVIFAEDPDLPNGAPQAYRLSPIAPAEGELAWMPTADGLSWEKKPYNSATVGTGIETNPSPEPTAEPLPSPTPTAVPTIGPTPLPTVAPTPEPTATPTSEPTPVPTPVPTPTPTEEPIKVISEPAFTPHVWDGVSDWDNVEIITGKPWSLYVETPVVSSLIATGTGFDQLLWYGTANGALLPGGEYRLILVSGGQTASAVVDILADARNQPLALSPDAFVMKDVERTGAPRHGIGTGPYWPYGELMVHYRDHWKDPGVIADETQPRGLRQYYEGARSLIARGQAGDAGVAACSSFANEPRTFFLDTRTELLAILHDQTNKIGTFFLPQPDASDYFYRNTGCLPANFVPSKEVEKAVTKAIHDAEKAAKKAAK